MIHFIFYKGEVKGEIVPGEDINKIVWVDSHYLEKGLEIGHPGSMKIIPQLKQEGLID